MTTRSLSDSRVTPGDEVFHDALERILQFGREKGKDHPVAVNTTVAILDALIALNDIKESDAEARRKYRRENDRSNAGVAEPSHFAFRIPE